MVHSCRSIAIYAKKPLEWKEADDLPMLLQG